MKTKSSTTVRAEVVEEEAAFFPSRFNKPRLALILNIGGALGPHPVQLFPPLQVADIFEFVHTPPYKDPNFLHEKYSVQGLLLGQIADEIFSSKDAVRSGLKRFEIPIREPHKPRGRPSSPRYGVKIAKGKSEPHKTEQRVIDAILEMKSQGLGLRQIARTLTQLGISTKCQGKAWHPEMVKRVLSRERKIYSSHW